MLRPVSSILAVGLLVSGCTARWDDDPPCGAYSCGSAYGYDDPDQYGYGTGGSRSGGQSGRAGSGGGSAADSGSSDINIPGCDCEELNSGSIECLCGDPSTVCSSDADCPANQVCDVGSGCLPAVGNCPLTPECIGDPPGYEPPEWRGKDPLFVGPFSGGATGQIRVDFDLYDDHVYGEGLIVGLPYDDSLPVVMTGIRQDAQIRGQVLGLGLRTFDGTFQATLRSGSEMYGSAHFASDDGNLDVTFSLLRASPCGCLICQVDLDCEAGMKCEAARCVPAPKACSWDADCPAGNVCELGLCRKHCSATDDCPAEMACEAGACMPACTSECCGDAACSDGNRCIGGTCKPPCTHRCDCQAGEACLNGVCAIPSEPQPKSCVSDCDCDYAGGERCLNQSCRIP